ncbi:ABC transporter substrate-binding protein [Paenibacillus humicola]|uniref:ABC transporter substrate-binding protein n=1 Tax=Paenibacillus humicola TaxID=3110540 RepID=UPI00237B8FAD|nr:sugar ABC transporter substrate-binding protein [Paenibacillus humicola]
MSSKRLGMVTGSVALAALLLQACSGGSGGSGGGADTGESAGGGNAVSGKGGEPVTITLLNAQSDGIREKFFGETAIPEFEKENPGIKVEIINTPFEEFDSKMSTLVAGGTPPDVWSHWGHSGFVDYMTRHLTLDLTPYMNDFNNPNISESTMKVYNVDGKQYGIPLSIFPSLVFYNKDLLDKAGVKIPNYKYGDPEWTWDKLIGYAKQVSKDYGKPSAVYGFTWNMGSHMATYSWDWGLDIFQDGYKTGFLDKADLTDPKFESAVKWYQDLILKDKITPTTAISDSLTKTGDPMLTGKVAFDLDGGWQLAGFKDQQFNFGVLPMPLGPAGTSTPFTYIDPLMISSKSKHPDAAWKFVKFMTSPDMQLKWATMTGYPPADSKAYQEWLKQFGSQVDLTYLTQVIQDSIAHGKESPNHLIAGYADITSLMKNEQQQIFTNGADPAKVLPEINEKFNKLLQQIKEKAGAGT